MVKTFKNKSRLFLVFFCFIGVNLVAALIFNHLRLDLTENKLNTLSTGTHNILQELSEPVTLKLYLSSDVVKELPGLDSYASQIRSLLKEYSLLSNGNLNLEIINPLPFSEEEDEAVSLGIQGVPVSGGETLYFGLSGQSGVRQKTISFFQPEREPFLEYDLSQLIYSLTHPERKVVGILSALPLQGSFIPGQGMSQPIMLFQQLRKQFSVRHLSGDETSIADDVDILVVVHPHGLSEKALYAIDQFVLGGGPSIVFVDPQSELQPPGGGQPLNDASIADRLLTAWGVKLLANQIVGDPNLAQQVSYRDKFGRSQTSRYLPWLSIGEQQYNSDEMLVNQLGRINVATIGALEHVGSSEFTPLISSTPQAGLIDKNQFIVGADPALLIANFKPGDQALVLAARVSGVFNTSFPDGAPLEEVKESAEEKDEDVSAEPIPEQIMEGSTAANLIVLADTDFLQDRFWVQVDNFFGQQLIVPNASNLDLVTNALEILSGSPDLISVRSRGSYQRPFELISQIQQKAEQRYRTKEQELLRRLDETEQKLNALQRQREDAGSAQLTVEQENEVESFIQEKVKTRKELRSVQYQLRADIVDLERTIKIFNIGFVPFFLGVTAFISWALRRNRSRAY